MITVTLPADVRVALDEATRREGVPADALVVEAVKQYLALRQFRLLRDRMLPHAQAQGVATDQDVFNRVS